MSNWNRRYHGWVTSADALKAMLTEAFPDAVALDVTDRTGGGDHFQVTLTSSRLNGLSRVDQHRLVYDALAGPLRNGSIHELRIRTRGTE